MNNKSVILSIAAVLLFSGCNTNENVSVESSNISDEAVTENVTVSETEASQETNSDFETSIESIIIEETASETTAETETETSAETVLEPVSEERYYECRFSTENVISSEEEFAAAYPGVIDEAKEIVKANPVYLQDLQDNSNPENNLEPLFKEAITDDFDHDGNSESFFFMCPDGWVGAFGARSYLFRADDNGVKLITDEYYQVTDYMESTIFSEIVYKDFSHLMINAGHNNSTMASDIYSVNGSETVREAGQKVIYEISNGFMLCCTGPQAPGEWFLYWDNIDKCYKTPSFRELSDDEIEQTQGLSEIIASIKADKEITDDSTLIPCLMGNKYYCFHIDEEHIHPLSDAYIFESGSLTKSNFYLCSPGYKNQLSLMGDIVPFAEEDISIDEISEQMVKLDS